MDVRMCMEHCASYTWFGIIGEECLCGTAIQEKDNRIEPGNCSTPCPGSKDLEHLYACGGQSSITAYRHKDYLSRSAAPEKNWSSRTWKNLTWTFSATAFIMGYFFFTSICGSAFCFLWMPWTVENLASTLGALCLSIVLAITPMVVFFGIRGAMRHPDTV
ncbi:hypothetical protein BU26DRAFT_202014 [Trematosphaeria pertusa]|uniref:WSC domain-containing protein n=1 Tax=Trematosphaeria pertusa TaxID=390896 RepID=A0A6A6HS20_9PLEO|nr:uncharacterized protein BU26DRAFT_202014 [Trematosphaeria pertusa]KAF2240896.1 hypothetical protein BU26DRAFT_202014 [Trematosphaeria pertusa]